MKHKLLLILSLAFFAACNEELDIISPANDFMTKASIEVREINKNDALSLVRPITDNYPEQWIEISNDPIPANTTLKFSDYEAMMENEEVKTTTSPSFESWVIVVDPDYNIDGIQDQLHIFVDTNNGKIEKRWIKGRVITSWDESRNKYIKTLDDKKPKETKSLPKTQSTSSDNKWAVIINRRFFDPMGGTIVVTDTVH